MSWASNVLAALWQHHLYLLVAGSELIQILAFLQKQYVWCLQLLWLAVWQGSVYPLQINPDPAVPRLRSLMYFSSWNKSFTAFSPFLHTLTFIIANITNSMCPLSVALLCFLESLKQLHFCKVSFNFYMIRGICDCFHSHLNQDWLGHCQTEANRTLTVIVECSSVMRLSLFDNFLE